MALLFSNAIVTLSGLYLVGLGIGALIRPEATKRFLESFATSAEIHFVELGARIVAGIALVMAAERMKFGASFLAFGWILIGTSVLLLALPWRLHRRFAAWAVPVATHRLRFFAFGALMGGGILLYAILVPPGCL